MLNAILYIKKFYCELSLNVFNLAEFLNQIFSKKFAIFLIVR